MIKTCICGRIGEHCPNAECGSVSKTPLKQRTTFMSRQTGLDVRYYTCRKCGVEYGWLNGKLYDGECYAPKEIHLVAAPQNIEQGIKDLNEAIQFIQLRGGVVSFPDGVKDINEKPPGVVEPRPAKEEYEALPKGWTYNKEGQKVSPLSLNDLFKKREHNENP